MLELSKSIKQMESGSQYLFEATSYIEPVLNRGEGSWVWDIDGNKYLDLNAGQFCLIFGHAYKPLVDLVSKQMMKISHTNTSTQSCEVFEAAEKMALISGRNLKKTIFLSTGSEANECALRYAKFATGKKGVLSIDRGYHGLTLASQASTMGGVWAMPQVPDCISIKTPDYVHSFSSLSEDEFLANCIQEAKEVFHKYGDSVAAFIIEPVIGVGGMVRIPDLYLYEIRELCNEYGVLLIFDECQCGFGRSGDWFVYQNAGVYPDILVTAKAMGLGLAVSAVTFSDEVAEKVSGKLTHFSSHQNDPLSAAVVSFVIDEINKNNLLQSNTIKGKILKEKITDACKNTELLCNPRGDGLMCAFDIDDIKYKNYQQLSRQFTKAMLENGVLIQAIRQGRTFRLLPNYYISEIDMNYLKDAIIASAESIIKT